MSNNRTPLLAHLSLAGAAICWGLMSPLGKDAMQHGIDGITLVSLRVLGGAILFWLTSLFTPRETISRKHIALLCLAAVFGLVGNQCCFTIGLSLTSPVNAGIVTTTMPISQRTHHAAQSTWSGTRMLRSCFACHDQCPHSCWSNGHGRPSLFCSSNLLHHLSHRLRMVGQTLQHLHRQQVDVSLCHLHHLAVHRTTRLANTLERAFYGHPRRNRIRRRRGNIPCLYPHDSRTTSVATHCREHVQLCSTHRCRHCQHRSWARCLHTHSCSGCRTHLLWSSTRHTLQVEKRFAAKPNEERRKYYV